MQKRLDDLYHGFCNKQDFTNRMLSVEESNKDLKFSKEELDEWRYAGLNNIDFIKAKILKYDNYKVLKF